MRSFCGPISLEFLNNLSNCTTQRKCKSFYGDVTIVYNSRNMGKKFNKNKLFGHFCFLPVFLWRFGAVSDLSYYRKKELKMIIKHLMTDPKRNSELYVSPRPSMSIEVEKSLGLPWGRGEQNSLFPAGPVMECFVIPPNSKNREKSYEEIVCFTRAGSQICRSFKEHDLITCESKVQVVVSLGS